MGTKVEAERKTPGGSTARIGHAAMDSRYLHTTQISPPRRLHHDRDLGTMRNVL